MQNHWDDHKNSEISENDSGTRCIYFFIYSFSWIQPRQYFVLEVLTINMMVENVDLISFGAV